MAKTRKARVHNPSIYTPQPGRHATRGPVDVVYTSDGVRTLKGDNIVGRPHVTRGGNDKTGPHVQSLSTDIARTCRVDAPCRKTDPKTGEKPCYGCKGCCVFGCNLLDYIENTVYILTHSAPEIAAAVLAMIAATTTLFRFLVVGDIVNTTFLEAMVLIANARPDIRFWAYTKKYWLVNRFVEKGGVIPGNLNILFSRWDPLPMENPHGFPMSVYVPFADRDKVVIRPGIDMICPCSSPDWAGTCEQCQRCARVPMGGIVYLIEHSTRATKDADRAAHKRQHALKAEYRSLKTRARGGDSKAIKALKAFEDKHINAFRLAFDD